MTKDSYPTRTTLWDVQPPLDPSAPQARSAWRAPSAVLAGARGDGSAPGRARRAVPRPSSEGDDVDDHPRRPIPRRTRFAAASRPWWRPGSTLGQVLLGLAALLLLTLAGAAAIATRSFLIHDARFRISGAASIQSSGLSEVNRAEVLPVFGEDIGRNIFFVPLGQRRLQLESIPWVRQATIMRFLPNRLSVSLVERTPVAFVRQGSQVELADADGVILSMPPAMMAQHHYSFPVITGIDPHDSLSARRARMATYQRFLAELDRNQQHQSQQVSEIDLSDPEDLRAVMPEQGSDILAHFGEDHFIERLQVFKAHIGEWRSRYPRLIGVDLRYNGQIPLEMATDAGVSAGEAAATASPAGPTAAEAGSSAKLLSARPASAANAKLPHPTLAARNAEARQKAAHLNAAREKAKAALNKSQTAHPTPAASKQAQPTP